MGVKGGILAGFPLAAKQAIFRTDLRARRPRESVGPFVPFDGEGALTDVRPVAPETESVIFCSNGARAKEQFNKYISKSI